MLSVKPLPYDFNALEPNMSAQTLSFHHDKHYAGYVAKANELMPIEWQDKSLADIITLARASGNVSLFNQVAQVWNHEFFFDGLRAVSSETEISSELLNLIQNDFQSVENLKGELQKAALSRFGSGWVWLIFQDGHLKIQTTSNAETPCGIKDIKPLWTLDVWEHAYYLDYQNRRADYANQVLNKLINWQFISNNLKG